MSYLRVLKIAQLQSTFSIMLAGKMKSAKTIQIADEVLRSMDLQVEVLRHSLLEMTASEVHEYEERRYRIGQLCLELG
jgi:hypothetical protein